MKIYLARPISGSTPEEVFKYYDTLRLRFELRGFEVLSPMTGKDEMRTDREFRAEGYKTPVSSNHAIFERDMWMVHQADIVFVYLPDNGMVSIGSMMELAVASDLGKHTVVVIEGEKNVHRHAFVLEAADIVFDSLPEALTYVERFT